MCRYRIVQDGLPLLLPYVTHQLLQPTVQEFLNLIEGRSLYVPEEARAVSAAGDAAVVDAAASNGVARAGSGANDQDVKLETETQSKQPNAGQPHARSWRTYCKLAVGII